MLAVVKVANPTAYGFVKAGEYYLTPNRSFNPWVPPYAGACGLMDANFIPDGQRLFHLFAECTSREKKKIDGEERERIMLPVTSWHGEDCAGAWLYLGYYEVDDEVPEQTFNFNSIRHVEGGDHAEWERVKYHFRHPRHKFGTDNEMAMLKKLKDGGYYDRIDNEIDVTGAVIDPTLKSETHGKKGLEHYAKKYGVLEAKVMDHLAVREWLREENKKMTLVGVKPCDGDRGYDERVYEALVQAQAWSPTVPRVETDPLLLGPLG